MKKLIFIKFGGSLITDKTKPNSVRLENIKLLASQVKEIISSNKDISIIIGTGAGSFGHHLVTELDIKNGIKKPEDVLSVARVNNSTATLNRIVVSALIQVGVSAVSINPSSIFLSSSNKLKKVFTEPLLGFLNKGFVPVVYGDMVFDDQKGASVFSTEKQFLSLLMLLTKKNIQVDAVIFCGTTDGVLDKNGKTILRIDKKIFEENKDIYFENNAVDVTGEMKQKVITCLRFADLGITSHIINGMKNDTLKLLVTNKMHSGTIIAK